MGDEIVKSVYLTPVLRLEVSAAVYKDRGSLYNGAEERFAKRANDRRKGKKRERDRGREENVLGLFNEYKRFLRAACLYDNTFQHTRLHDGVARIQATYLSAFLRVIHSLCVFCTPKMCSYKAPNNSGTQPRA